MAYKSYNPDYTGQHYAPGSGAYGEGTKSSYAEGFVPSVAPVGRSAPAAYDAQAEMDRMHTFSWEMPKRRSGGTYLVPGAQRNVGTRTVQRVEFDPEAVMPELNIPTFEAPEFDDRAVRAKAQRIAGPQIRRLRDVIQAAAARNYENPNVRKMTLRQALAGYGQGLGDVMTGAHREAQAEEMQEYQTQYGEALQNWNARVAAANRVYDSAFQKYLASAKRTTESRDLIEPISTRSTLRGTTLQSL